MACKENKRVILRKIREYADILRENGINVWRLYLFGSYASGSAAEYSDLELAIFLIKRTSIVSMKT